ncbi:hypothetical protein [Candidatus Methylospira mobilis]
MRRSVKHLVDLVGEFVDHCIPPRTSASRQDAPPF